MFKGKILTLDMTYVILLSLPLSILKLLNLIEWTWLEVMLPAIIGSTIVILLYSFVGYSLTKMIKNKKLVRNDDLNK